MTELLALAALKAVLVLIGAVCLFKVIGYFILGRSSSEEYQLTGQLPQQEIAPPPPPPIIARRSLEIIGSYLGKPIHSWVELTTGERYLFESVAVKRPGNLYMVDHPACDYLVVDKALIYRQHLVEA